MNDPTGAPTLYDEETGLREIAKYRLRRDTPSRSTVQLADHLTEYLTRHFAAEATETAGRAILIAASGLEFLRQEGIDNPAAMVNILGLTAARLVADGRAWLDAQGSAHA
jgi:hypothetical protein